MHARESVELRTERLRLWMPGPRDAAEMARYQHDNRHHLGRWSPAMPADFTAVAFWQKRLARNLREAGEERAARFAVSWSSRDVDRIIGTVGLTEIERGPLQSCLLGYGLDEAEQGQGVMTEAVAAVIDFAFDTLGLHRIRATYDPRNERSAAVLRRLGFEIEGHAREYLFVNGAWQDHVLAALINSREAR